MLGQFSGITHTAHVEIERLQHGSETVLQTSYGILSLAERNVDLHVASGYALRLFEQQTKWLDG